MKKYLKILKIVWLNWSWVERTRDTHKNGAIAFWIDQEADPKFTVFVWESYSKWFPQKKKSEQFMN